MAELIRPAPVSAGGLFKDQLGSPSTGSEDGGGPDLADLAADLDLDEVDGPNTNGICKSRCHISSCVNFTKIWH